MTDARTFKVSPNGLAIFGKFSHALQQAEAAGENPPAPDADAEVIAAWLSEHDKLEGITREEAALLIEMVASGGVMEAPALVDGDDHWEGQPP